MGGRAHGTEGGRRRLPRLLLLSQLSLIVAACHTYASADAPAPEPAPETEQPEYLFMMTAANATFVPGVDDNDGLQTLDGFDDETIAFTDRPGREASLVATDVPIRVFFFPVDGLEDDIFYVDLPNADFSCPLGSGEVARAVYVLLAPSESDSDVAFEVEVLYASVQGVIECDGPAVRRKMHALSCPVVLNETSGLTWTSLQDARRGLRTLGRTAGIGPLFPDPTFLSVPRRGLTRGLANDVKRGPRARRRRRPRRCPRR